MSPDTQCQACLVRLDFCTRNEPVWNINRQHRLQQSNASIFLFEGILDRLPFGVATRDG